LKFNINQQYLTNFFLLNSFFVGHLGFHVESNIFPQAKYGNSSKKEILQTNLTDLINVVHIKVFSQACGILLYHALMWKG